MTQTETKTKIQTIDISALEWFDKSAGNSYFAGTITINFGMPDQRNYIMPYQYGYGEHYTHAAAELLQQNGEMPDRIEYTYFKDGQKKSNGFEPLWQWAKRNNVIVRNVKHENCKKRELKELSN